MMPYPLIFALLSLLVSCWCQDQPPEQAEAEGIRAVDSDFLFLYMKKSSLPFEEVGQGVFTKVPVFKNEIICEYRGAIIPSDVPFESNYIYHTKTLDGKMIHIVPDMNKPICAYINDCVKILGSNYTIAELNDIIATNGDLPTYDGFKHNAGTLYTKLGKIFIVAIEDIPANTEVFYPYGTGYWIARLRDPAAFGIPIEPPR
jgi:hypothetical protein